MNIMPSSKPYTASPSRQARIDARQELNRLLTLPDVTEQLADCRTEVLIGEQSTWWSKGLSADTPTFLEHAIGGVRRVHLLSAGRRTVVVYDHRGGDDWERRAILQKPDQILASLPKKALFPNLPVTPASPKQIATLRKILELPSELALDELSSIAASRLLDRILLENSISALFGDATRWIEQQAASPEIAA